MPVTGYFSADEYAANRNPQDTAADTARGITPTQSYQNYLQIPLSQLGAGRTAGGLYNGSTGLGVVDTSSNPAPGSTSVRADGSTINAGHIINNSGTGAQTPVDTSQNPVWSAPSTYADGTPAGSGIPGSSTYRLPSSLSSAALGGATPINYISAGDMTGASTGVLNGIAGSSAQDAANAKQYADAAAKLGPQDTQIHDLIASTLGLNSEEAGKAGYQAQQDTAAGVDTAQKTVTDLETLQQQNLASATAHQNALQTGQGVTTAVDARQRAEQLRLDTIQTANTSSLLAAAKGNLTTAQALADKAVALKYGPIEAKITAAMANINLLKADPATTQEEKAKADEMATILDQQKIAIADQKAQATEVSKVAVTAASYLNNFTATAQYQTASQALQAVQSAPDAVTAQMIASQTGLTAPLVKTGTWSAPYTLGTNIVQKNDVTGEIRTAVNPPNAPAVPKPSAADEKQSALFSLSSAITSGQKMSDGTPILDANGNITPKALQHALAQAPSMGLTEADVINTVRPYIFAPDGTVSSNYGLSVAQQKLINSQ